MLAGVSLNMITFFLRVKGVALRFFAGGMSPVPSKRFNRCLSARHLFLVLVYHASACERVCVGDMYRRAAANGTKLHLCIVAAFQDPKWGSVPVGDIKLDTFFCPLIFLVAAASLAFRICCRRAMLPRFADIVNELTVV